MRLIDDQSLTSKAKWSNEFEDYVVTTTDLDAAPTVRCAECVECDTCKIHDHAMLDVPNFGCAYFKRKP